MEEIPALTQSIFLKTHLLKSYQNNSNQYSTVFKEELNSEIRRFKKYADRNRTITPYFQPRDKVWQASQNIKTMGPTKKIAERWLGPLKSSRRSEAMHIPSSCLKNGIIVEEQEEWEVAQVLDSNLKRSKLWYLVEWKGFSEDQERTAWEPASNLTNSPDLFKDLHSLYPNKPGPNTSRV
ncbi:hypothetical protein O181_123363 [Austropuccinia psidii MF-1]|uniref:Chromo domain-containing protein n=1 Tax=Austropuccinia psidii MF-1 TaxID=1389203 RepID=A0A9Q3KL01_9BASI|nr:hypothetical protein [Austropuccinia psidii MF-1]